MDERVSQKTEENETKMQPNLNGQSFAMQCESLKVADMQIIDEDQNPQPQLHLNRINVEINKLKKILSTQIHTAFAVCEGKEKYSKCIKKFINLNEDYAVDPSFLWIENAVRQKELNNSAQYQLQIENRSHCN